MQGIRFAIGAIVLVTGCGEATRPPVTPPARPPVTVATKPVAAPRLAEKLFLGPMQTCLRDATGAVRCAGGNFTDAFPHTGLGPDACPTGGDGCHARMTSIPAFAGFEALAFGFFHTCGRGPRGLVCWGDIEQLRGSRACDRPVACRAQTEVAYDIKGVLDVATTTSVTCARTATGEVYCWGWNDFGLVGDGTTDGEPCAKIKDHTMTERIVKCRLAPTRVVGIANAKQVVMGASHACALLVDGTVRCWGQSEHGQLGDDQPGDACTDVGKVTTCRSTPVMVKGLDRVTQISAGRLHTCAVREDGSVWCWGFAYGGRLGRAVDGFVASPAIPIAGIIDAVEVAAGFTQTCVRTKSNKVLCWGLAPTLTGPWTRLEDPTEMTITGEPVGLAADESTYCVMVKQGPPQCWGENGQGQLAVPATKVITKPTPLAL